MTTLHDFHQTLSKDRTDWLVLADWLEECGDERGEWVRFVAGQSVGIWPHDFRYFSRRYLKKQGWPLSLSGNARPEPSDWFLTVMWLADVHVAWEAICVDEPEMRQLASLVSTGHSCGEIDRQLGSGEAGKVFDIKNLLPKQVQKRKHELLLSLGISPEAYWWSGD